MVTKDDAIALLNKAIDAIKELKGKDSDEYSLCLEALVVLEHDLTSYDDAVLGI